MRRNRLVLTTAGSALALRRLRTEWLVLAAWLIALGPLGPLAGKLGDVEKTGPNAVRFVGGCDSSFL